MTSAAFVFFYLIAVMLAMQKPMLIVWGFGIYTVLVMRRVWSSWYHKKSGQSLTGH